MYLCLIHILHGGLLSRGVTWFDILKVGSITKNTFEKAKIENRFNFWEAMTIDKAKYNSSLHYIIIVCIIWRYRLIKDILGPEWLIMVGGFVVFSSKLHFLNKWVRIDAISCSKALDLNH